MLLNFRGNASGDRTSLALVSLVAAMLCNCVVAVPARASKTPLPPNPREAANLFLGQKLARHCSGDSQCAQAEDEKGAAPDQNDASPREGHGRVPAERAGAFNRPREMGRPWDHFGPGPLDLTPLNLSPEQKQKIQDIRKQTGIKARDLRKALKAKRSGLRDAMFDPEVSDAKLRERHREVSKLHQKAEDAMFEDFLSIRALLTPEQKKHLPEVKPPFREPSRFEGGRMPPGAMPPPESKGKSAD